MSATGVDGDQRIGELGVMLCGDVAAVAVRSRQRREHGLGRGIIGAVARGDGPAHCDAESAADLATGGGKLAPHGADDGEHVSGSPPSDTDYGL